MSRPESPEARAERITAELREATREAAGILKDLAAAMREARAQADGYAHDVVESTLAKYTDSWQEAADQFHADMREDVTGRIVQWVAVVQNEVSKGAIFRSAVDAILAELHKHDDERRAHVQAGPPGITIMACPRPHAD